MLIGEYLLQQGAITKEQLQMGLSEARASGSMLGDCLVRLGFLRWKFLEDTLKQIAPETLIDTKTDQEEIILPRDFMLATRTIFRGDLGSEIAIATLHHNPEWVASEAKRLTGKNIRLVGASQSDFVQGIYTESPEASGQDSLATIEDPNQIISMIIGEALQLGASDIHIESTEFSIHIRYRIDGILHPIHILNNNIMERLFTRIKGEAGMDEAQRREPQDGAFTKSHKGRSIDFRVATVPTATGEKITMRILDKDRVMVDIRTIGITAIEDWMYLSQQTNGLILVCGATGSGKTTTLYSTIMSLDRIHKAIYTIEDPIEYQLPCINQVQINPRLEFSFARALRSFLRHDPDIIIVGEIRDPETAENTVHAADTGHLVYATMHTNDIPSTISRLQNLKINIEQLSYCLRGIIVQKLARKLCAQCNGAGCAHCSGGYQGRTLISEFVRIDSPEDMYSLTKREKKYQTFVDDAKIKVREGVTDCREVSRVMNDDVWFCNGGNCINAQRSGTDHICNWIGEKKTAAALGRA